jgi:hypothetical protein
VIQLREVSEQVDLAGARREESEYFADGNAGAAHAGLAEANFRIDMDAIQMMHIQTLCLQGSSRQMFGRKRRK